MIKKITLSLLAIIILASCSSKFGVQKRRYTKGFYVSSNKNKNLKTKDEAIVKLNVKQEAPEQIEAVTVQSSNTQEATLPVKINLKPTEFKVKALNQTVTKSKEFFYASIQKEVMKNEEANLRVDQNLEKTSSTNLSRSGGSSTNKIVLVILCIFIPFLAVFLFEDAIKSDFWLDLLLCILFWLPGMVYAFLVCFAGVSVN